MPKNENKQQSLTTVRTTSGYEQEISCEICVTSNDIFCVKSVSPKSVLQAHEKQITSTFVDRRSKKSGEPMMTATKFIGLLQPGTQINMADFIGQPIRKDAIEIAPKKQVVAQEVRVNAKWNDRSKERGASGRDASVFGGLGVLEIEDGFNALNIPVQNALDAPPGFLAVYGAILTPVGCPIDFPSTGDTGDEQIDTLYITEYTWNNDYINEYVMHEEGGGGLFVETHPFPHVFTPLSPDCGGALILGRRDPSNSSFIHFTSFKIPYGYSLTLKSDVIHGDSFFTGPYAIALTETELADSVLMKTAAFFDHESRRETRGIQPVQQGGAILKMSLVEKRLIIRSAIRQAARDLQYNKSSSVTENTAAFFRSVDVDVLHELRHEHPAIQREFDKRRALTPLPELKVIKSHSRKP